MKLNNKTLFNRKILIGFADNIGFRFGIDLVGFKHVLYYSKIEGSIIP